VVQDPESSSAIVHSREVRYSGPGGTANICPSHFVLDKSNRVFDPENEDLLDSEGHKNAWNWHGDSLPLDARRKDSHSPAANLRRNESPFVV
jgi:hypothetical protein